jgi:iron complex transport system permease protein
MGLGALLLLAIILRLLVVPEGLLWPREADWGLRGRRVLSGGLVGASLGVGGVMLQSLLRNPLASPDLIGPAAGAGLAVSLAVWLGAAAVLTGPAALAGAFGALALVYILSQRRGLMDPISLVLVGVMVSIISGAAMMLVVHLMPPQARLEISYWMLGSLSDEVSVPAIAGTAVVCGGGIALGMWLGRAMDVAALSEDEARSAGVPVGWLRLGLFAGSGALTAAAVVLAGPVGFIGLVAPHLVRVLAGPAHRALIGGAALAGAALVILADSAVRALHLETGRMPLGIVTALVGGPVFLLLLRREMTGRY